MEQSELKLHRLGTPVRIKTYETSEVNPQQKGQQ